MTSNKLLTLFNLRAGEGKMVAWVLLYALLSTITYLFANTAAYALFLSAFSAQRLPYIYVGSSIIATLLSLLYLRLSQRYSLAQLLIGQFGFILLTLIGYRIGLSLIKAPWFIFSLPIWDGVVSALFFTAFWNLAGRLFNLQQGKRLFGLIGAGAQAATLLVGCLVPTFVAWGGTANLFIVAAIAGLGALGALFYLMRTFAQLRMPGHEEVAEDGAPETEALPTTKSLLAEPYIRFIFILYIFYGLGAYFIDNIFYTQVESQLVSQDQLASFLGTFSGVVGGISLLNQLFVAPRLLSRYGVRVSILLTPILLLIGTSLFVAAGLLAPWAALLFGLAVLLNLTSQFSDASDSTAANLLYQPLPTALRTHAQTTVDGIISPSAAGLAGLLLIGLTSFWHFDGIHLGLVLLPILIGWALIAVRLGQLYPKRVQQALHQRIVQGNTAFQPDRASLDILQQNLLSPHPGAVVYALDILETLDRPALLRALPTLLQHPSEPVRLEALARLERLGVTSALPAIEQACHHDTEAKVRAAALRTLATLGGIEQFADIDTYLSTLDPPQRQGLMVGLLRSGELEGILAVGETLTHLVNSPIMPDRIFAAQVLGESGLASFYRPLLKLLRDPEPLVRRAALGAAGKLAQPKLWPVVIENLYSPQTRSSAQTALVMGGSATLPALRAALASAEADTQFRCALVRVCGRLRNRDLIELLVAQLAFPDREVRVQTLQALQLCGYQAPAPARAQFEQQIQAELAHAAWTLASYLDLAETSAAALLRSALEADLRQQRVRLFVWLSLLYDAGAMARVRDAFGAFSTLRQASDEQKAYALETIDVLVAKTLTKNLLPLLDNLPPAQQLRRLAADFPQPALSLPQRLHAIITGGDAWISHWVRAVAIYITPTSPVPAEAQAELRAAVAAACAAPAGLVRETATWALFMLDAKQATITPDKNQPGKNEWSGGQKMLLTIEKVIILKTIDIFANTPDEILVDIAALLKEITVAAGQPIFQKGDQGDSMYIIIEGEVEALDGERVFTRMGERQVFGEMALLDREPRTATIRATQATRLLRLDQEPFYELMDDRIEIARGVIHILLQRLRARTSDVNRLQAQLNGFTQSAQPATTPNQDVPSLSPPR